MTVTPGQTLYLNVGGAPRFGCRDSACLGGFNGGGTSGNRAGGGGGASDVRTVSRSETGSLKSRLLVAAGGGGGAASFACTSSQNGGAGGDADSAGGNGAACQGTPGGTGGGAGTASAGGAGGSPGGATGSLGQGSTIAFSSTGGGGGGGLYGGGGGGTNVFGVNNVSTTGGGGGGGSSLDPDGGSITLDDSRTPQITVSYTKQDQTISFTSTAPTSATLVGSYTPTAIATSGLNVTLGTSTPNVCTFSDGTVSFIATGECIVTADQAGDASYNPAAQATQSFTVSLPPVVAEPYTIDFETASANRILYSVKVGQGVTYQGQGSASSASVPVVGKRANNGKILEAQVARVVSIYGSKRLIIGSSASSNTPSPTGGRIKLSFTNYDPAGAKLTSMTLSNLTKRGAYLTFYYVDGSSSRQNLGTTSAGGSLVIPLAIEGLRAVDVYAPNAYTVDDVKFEVTARR